MVQGVPIHSRNPKGTWASRWLRGKNLPATQESQVQFLGQKDPPEKETAAHSNILPWTEEPGGATVPGVAKEVDTT